ncbi:MAG: acyl-CoA dehydrogenase family protein, partial [bacterium]
MSFTSEDREFLKESIQRMLQQEWPESKAVELQQDPEAQKGLYQKIAEQGLLAMGYSEDTGGLQEIIMAQVELGAAACPAPLTTAAIANLLLSDQESAAALLEAVQTGEACLAIAAPVDELAAGQASLEGGKVNGTVSHIEHADIATHFLVAVDGGLAVVERSDAIQVEATAGYSVPSLSQVTFNQADASLIELDSDKLQDIARLYRLQLAARSYGAAQRGYELVVEHVKTRKQFGVAIGTFQAVQHKLANCLMSLDGVKLNLEYAASQYDLGKEVWRVCSAVTFTVASDYLRQVVLETHHAFGAIGFSEEHELPRHYRRIHGDMARLGGTKLTRAEVASYLLDGETNSLPGFDMGEAANQFREEVKAFLAENW